jgi:hypothetical protein
MTETTATNNYASVVSQESVHNHSDSSSAQ